MEPIKQKPKPKLSNIYVNKKGKEYPITAKPAEYQEPPPPPKFKSKPKLAPKKNKGSYSNKDL